MCVSGNDSVGVTVTVGVRDTYTVYMICIARERDVKKSIKSL